MLGSKVSLNKDVHRDISLEQTPEEILLCPGCLFPYEDVYFSQTNSRDLATLLSISPPKLASKLTATPVIYVALISQFPCCIILWAFIYMLSIELAQAISHLKLFPWFPLFLFKQIIKRLILLSEINSKGVTSWCNLSKKIPVYFMSQ